LLFAALAALWPFLNSHYPFPDQYDYTVVEGLGIVMKLPLFCLQILVVLVLGCRQREATVPAEKGTQPIVAIEQPITAEGLHNVWSVTDKMLSGSSPEGEAGFRSLQRLGVHTIISVDGARPDVESARKFNLRYVHLPIGYDGISRDQALHIAKAVRDLPGLVYVHCHHGKHRGPAAAAVARYCLDEKCGIEGALAVMHRAGTDPRYVGLYQAPSKVGRIEPNELDGLNAEFHEVAKVSGLAEIMVKVDERWDRLKMIRTAGWIVPKEHVDLDPPHEALQLSEQFREIIRRPEMESKPNGFRGPLNEALSATAELESALRESVVDKTLAERSFARISKSCQLCHDQFRDQPHDNHWE
jgi:hypothetical protein